MRSRSTSVDRCPRYLPAAIAAALALLVPAVSAAQTVADAGATAPAKKPAGGKTVELKQIVVTAEKHETNLQKTASAITAVSADTLQNDNIRDVSGLNGMVPGLVVAKSAGGERMLTIRGVGSETPENTNTQPGVAYHIDGVYIVNSIATNAAFIDVDHVEVLRGPQGTLFGQSSTGGTVNVVTHQPELGAWSGDASLGLGNYGALKSTADLNIPLADKFALRVSLQKNKHDGYAKQIQTSTDHKEDGIDELGSKVSLLWAPLSNLSVTLTALNYVGDNSEQEQKNILDPAKNARHVSQDFPGFTHIRSGVYYGTVKWDLPFATFKSITSFQKLHSNLAWDADALDQQLFGGYDHVASWSSDVTSFSQELNLASHPGGRVDWIAGLLYLRSTNRQYTVEFAGDDPDPSFAVPSVDGPAPGNLSYEYRGSLTRDSLAPFAQATWHISDALRLTAGARFNHDKFDGYASSYYSAMAKVSKTTSNEKTGKLELDYDLTPASMLYASVTRGYKPGGINGGSTDAMEVAQTFKPETVNSFEVGSKNRFLSNRLQANFALFQYNYKNMQYLQEDPLPYENGIGNVPKSRIRGLESEFSYLPTARLRLDASVTYLHGKLQGNYYALDAYTAAKIRSEYAALGYGSFAPQTIAAVAAAAENTHGASPAKLPRWTGNASASYTLPVGEGSLTPRLEYVFRGNYQSSIFDHGPVNLTPSYGLWNFSLQYLPPDIHWTFLLSVTNLFNKDGIDYRFTDPYGSGQTFNTYVAPRQYMLTASYSF